ncbi:MAG: ACP S-malonyltransferase [Acidimicrobiia bacterium]|nr:ACP S-malonyltransferase [Acidimicrobiia bacterium]
MRYAVLFPGQGSQVVGMAEDVLISRPDLLGDAANQALGWDLADTIRNGPEELLTQTDRAQPSLYATSYAVWEAFRAAVAVAPSAAAGHSLGEYTALAAAGVLDYWDGLRLVAARGRAMANAAGSHPSSMAALLGADPATAESVAADRREAGGALWVANLNSPGQIVLSGGAEDIEWLVANARDLGIRRAVQLNVAGGFHSPLMASAAESLQEALAGVEYGEPAFPVYTNVAAAPADNVADSLAAQLTSPVRFEETVNNMVESGVDTFVHIGPGDVTAGLVKRTAKSATTHVVSSLGEASLVAHELSVQ